MPVSKKQLRWAHTDAGKKALGPSRVKKWDKESKGKKLPETSNGMGSALEKLYKS